MGEVDTKPIESVQAALSLFEDKADHRKSRPTSTDMESEKEREIEGILKDLANYKVQLEAKDAAYMQALLKLQHNQYTAEELSTLVQSIEIERDEYIRDCKEARTRVDELESKVKEMADQLSETAELREQLMHVFSELKATQAELFSMETDLARARDSELKALTQAELMESAFVMEQERTEELVRQVADLNEAIFMSKGAAIEAENDKLAMLSEKDAEIELATQAALKAQEQLEDARIQTLAVQELENQLLSKSEYIEMLKYEIKDVNEQLVLSKKAASDAIDNLKLVQEELEGMERKNFDQDGLIESLEMELNQLKQEIINANEVANRLKVDVEILTSKLQEARSEIDEIKQRENNALVEIAMLESELHRGRSKIAAAEAAEARKENMKSGMYLAIQQLAIEAETAKMENRMLKQGADGVEEEADEQYQDAEASEIEELNVEEDHEERKEQDNGQLITISLKEYECLIEKAEKADQIPVSLEKELSFGRQSSLSATEDKSELERLGKELEAALEKVVQFRNRAEQAVTRADLAETAKAGLEDQIRRWREHRQKRRAALIALREVAAPKEYGYHAPQEFSLPEYNEIQKENPPLGQVLNLKF
ncbi:putative WEB family protein [Rosa chinensis]|uniref:Putative WEB family protein n=1 Tax=Rosa chinensis TaxID=74649 RepID=A0A2P6P2U5_ROSCH|nr:protein WEAK CHLOROPLAST MOVEMENT UNDER BLUE LIGHT-like 3 isoform X1 [Rosa chinensis]XP_040367482.1 protein WEAK CHLOROPLAST MOVEMENT UNDER BLUE LIGHT-like 3 isoform X1 [Rosa chinensis]XP_040367483.1 protein WEAK CHLOROPLAST MOVEMENT UNDER BLUE LIGHT-like 3 isoform X1 [Rosa chinensis]PRQ16256.1 putative WEB family protein [Rosa chinensis]